jgi:hypothetical protein
MKNLMKSVVFAVAMLLAVSVQAENKPENAMRTNPETVIINKIAEPVDVQQVPCIIFVYVCGNYIQLPGVFYGSGCDNLTVAVQSLLDQYSSCN